MFRSAAERKVRAAGYDPARLPPGQHLTAGWPVLHAGEVPPPDTAGWTLRIFGAIEREVVLDWRAFGDLPTIHKRGRLRAITRIDTRNYFVRDGRPAGFEYEMVKWFAQSQGQIGRAHV